MAKKKIKTKKTEETKETKETKVSPKKKFQGHLVLTKTDDPKAIGGVMNSKSYPKLRIDVTQHQMHAVILARRFIYKK